ncbi:sialidase, partial [Escherichia coli]
MSALVLGAALFAFSPRPLPAFPATAIHADRLQINGLAHAGATRIVAVGERGVILLSDDAGAH